MSNVSKLDRQGVTGLCRKLGFDTDKYRLSYGSALVMHGVKEFTHDIDMDVSRDLFEELAKQHPLLDARFGEKYICIDGIVDVFVSESVDKNVEYIDRVPVASLEHVKEAKRRLGRAKDLEDIKTIEDFFKKRRS